MGSFPLLFSRVWQSLCGRCGRHLAREGGSKPQSLTAVPTEHLQPVGPMRARKSIKLASHTSMGPYHRSGPSEGTRYLRSNTRK